MSIKSFLINGVEHHCDYNELENIPEINGVLLKGKLTTEELGIKDGKEGPQGEPGAAGADGYSPTVAITEITGGHRVTVTDKNGAHTFDVMDGEGSEGGTEEIFWATYGTTTSAEIEAAYQAGKLCLATYGVAAYMLISRVSATYHTFGSISTGGRLGFCLCNNNAWSVSNVPIPTKTSDLTNDSGFYSKPSTGIPKSDLASAVQTSLDNADTALQSVPSTYRTAAAQDTIDAGKIDKPSNPATGAFLVWNGSAWAAQTLATWQGGSY